MFEIPQQLTRLRNVGLGLAGLATVALFIATVPPARKAVFCYTPINPFELQGVYVVFVPDSDHDDYNEAFLAFARKNGFTTASREGSLNEQSGKIFRNLQSDGCAGSAWISSNNVVFADEFIVTFDYNWLFGKKKAVAAERAFLAEFGTRFKIRRERDVARERGY
jgi:hypothetical protein